MLVIQILGCGWELSKSEIQKDSPETLPKEIAGSTRGRVTEVKVSIHPLQTVDSAFCSHYPLYCALRAILADVRRYSAYMFQLLATVRRSGSGCR